jgi:enoyl-CoA hydratase
VEFFQHPWEVGVRKAKEMLFTSDFLSAEEAKQLGMVNQIVPKEKLQDAALEMAAKITKKSLFALKLTKEAVNVAQDVQGRAQAMQTSFALHQLAHTHWSKLYNMLIDPTGLPPETQKALGMKVEKK